MTTQTYRLTRLEKITDDISIVHLTPTTTPIIFQPGQYVIFHLPNGEKAPFSMANRSPEVLEFHIRHGDNNPVSNHFLDYLKRHKQIELSGAFGQCLLPQTLEPLVFLAGGTGIASHKPLIEQALDLNFPKVSLYWGVKELEDLYIPDWLATMSSHDRFESTVVLSGINPNWPGLKGWVHEVMIAKESIADKLVYVSGPYEMVQTVAAVYKQNHYPLDRLLSDML